MKYIYDKYNVYFALFLNDLKYEEECFSVFKEYNTKFQIESKDLIRCYYNFQDNTMYGTVRNIKNAIAIPEEEFDVLEEIYYRYNFYLNSMLDTRFYDHVADKLNYWQKKYVENFAKYGNFSEVNFVDKKIYFWS